MILTPSSEYRKLSIQGEVKPAQAAYGFSFALTPMAMSQCKLMVVIVYEVFHPNNMSDPIRMGTALSQFKHMVALS